MATTPLRSLSCLALGAFLLIGLPAHSQGPKVTPKLEPVAETKLIMEGLAHANFRGLERILAEKPVEEKSWVFARGQALLIAEAGNLLMIRPPKKEGQSAWFERAMELRAQAAQLAQTIARKDFERSRAGLLTVAASCNRCHQSFRIPVQISAFEEK
jgi:hypothetical protein